MLDQIMEVLTKRRMMSVGNLALHFEMEPEELQPRLDQLEADDRIRFAVSRCSGSCSTCSTCSSEEDAGECGIPPVDPTSIVISMERRAEEA